MSVKTQHALYMKYSTKWKRCRDVAQGQDEMRASGEMYIPRLKDQDAASYKAYVERANFYNATWRTMAGLSGMLFRKPPKQEVPAAVEKLLIDTDMAGTPFNLFSQQIVDECLEVGRIGIMVDHPPKAPNVVSLADANARGFRPMMKIYKAEHIINWDTARINNATVLSMVVLTEAYQWKESEFVSKSETRYRVLDLDPFDNLYRVRVFRIDEKTGKDELVELVFPLMNGKRLNYIPFVIIGVKGVDPCPDEPPLIDLVDLNISHWRTSADYEHGCHFTGLPTPYVTGYQKPVVQNGVAEPKFYIGSHSAWTFADANAKVDFLEFSGQGLSALEKNLDRKEQQMAILGARMIAQEKKAAETATTSAIHRTGENSILSAIAISVSLALEKALTWFAEWAHAAGKVEYEINREFMPVLIDAATLTALVKSWQEGAMSFEAMFDLLQRGDMQDSELTAEDEQKRINDNPAPGPKLDPNKIDPKTGKPYEKPVPAA